MPFRESRNTNTGKQILYEMSTKAELFPGESILRFIHQSQHRKLFASWLKHYNQSEAVPNIPGKREHDYRRRFTDVSSPDFSWGRGDVCTQAICLHNIIIPQIEGLMSFFDIFFELFWTSFHFGVVYIAVLKLLVVAFFSYQLASGGRSETIYSMRYISVECVFCKNVTRLFVCDS